jgi:hypothetical protein
LFLAEICTSILPPFPCSPSSCCPSLIHLASV